MFKVLRRLFRDKSAKAAQASDPSAQNADTTGQAVAPSQGATTAGEADPGQNVKAAQASDPSAQNADTTGQAVAPSQDATAAGEADPGQNADTTGQAVAPSQDATTAGEADPGQSVKAAQASDPSGQGSASSSAFSKANEELFDEEKLAAKKGLVVAKAVKRIKSVNAETGTPPEDYQKGYRQLAKKFRSLLVDAQAVCEGYEELSAILAENASTMTAMSKEFKGLEIKYKAAYKKCVELTEINRRLNEKIAVTARRDWSAKSEKNPAGHLGEYTVVLDEEDELDNVDPLEQAMKASEVVVAFMDENGVIHKITPAKKSEGEDPGKKDAKEGEDPTEKDTKEGDSPAPGKKRGGNRGTRKAFDKLPKKVFYDLNIDALNREYGEENWDIVSWHRHWRVVRVRSFCYVQEDYTATIKGVDTDDMRTYPSSTALIPGSYLSSSFYADYITQKFAMGVPYYRYCKQLHWEGVPIERNQLATWALELAQPLGFVADNFASYLLDGTHAHADETRLRVLQDGRPVGSLSYIFGFRSGFFEKHKVSYYDYQETRKADFVLDFFDNWEGTLTTDYYKGYPKLGRESGGAIQNSWCHGHSRRGFVTAFHVPFDLGLPKELMHLTLEYYLVDLYTQIYRKYIPLVCQYFDDPVKRLEGITKEVAPKVYHLFKVLDALDLEPMRKPQPLVIETKTEPMGEGGQEDPGEKGDAGKPMPVLRHVSWKDGINPTGKELYIGTMPMSDKLLEAINYARDPQKRDGFLLFLKDPMVYIDNSPEEQEFIRLAIARKNFLFADVIEGGRCIATHMSLVESAILNDEDPYVFLYFLLDWFVPQCDRVIEEEEDGKKKVTYHLRDPSILQQTYPWGETYQTWKKENAARVFGMGDWASTSEAPVSPYRKARREAAK